MKVYSIRGSRFADGDYTVESWDSPEGEALRDSISLEREEIEEGKNHSFFLTVTDGDSVKKYEYHGVCGDCICSPV